MRKARKLLVALIAVGLSAGISGRVVEEASATVPPRGAFSADRLEDPSLQPCVIPSTWKAEHPFVARFEPAAARAEGAEPQGGPVIDLKAIRFSTSRLVSMDSQGRRHFLPPDLSSFNPLLVRDEFAHDLPELFLVQAASPRELEALKSYLASIRVAVRDYIPELAFLVQLDRQQREALTDRSEVFWAGLFQPAFRLDPKLEYIALNDPDRPLHMTVILDRGVYSSLAAARAGIAGKAVEPEEITPGNTPDTWIARLKAPAREAYRLAALPGTLWVERFVEAVLHNNVARTSANTATGRGAVAGPVMDVEDVWARGIRGEGQIAAAADTGLDTGNLSTLHHDFGQQGSSTNPLRVIKGYALARSTWDDPNPSGGHGTHTSGSIVGNGVRSGSDPATNTFPATSFAGTAPKAQFVFQSIMTSTGGLSIPSPISNLFLPPYADGARVHSNSWGAAAAGAYNTNAQGLDSFTWSNKDMVITFSAGNSGEDTSPADGVIDTDSVGSPGTAKNCITVGASENHRPDFVYEYPEGDCTPGTSDPRAQQAWYWFDSSSYSADPIRNDLMADNANGMGAFSSRGPADDGRIKPELVAPGIAIISTRTSVNQQYEQWGICNVPTAQRPYYLTMGGTSMSNPLTAGAAVLVRQYYTDGWHANHSSATNSGAVPADGFNPSSALVKATLVNGAWDMGPGQYGTGTTREIPPGWDSPRDLPNNAQGWGRVDLERSLFPGSGWGDSPGRLLEVHDVSPGLSTGGYHDYTFVVGSDANPLVVTLAWTDPPGALFAATELVNDLDLQVFAPGGTQYFPNRKDFTGGSADRKNNLEQVYVSSPASGTWSIRVNAYNVPTGPQPYALVVSGVSCAVVPGTPTAGSATATSSNEITVTWSPGSPAGSTYRVLRADGACPGGTYSVLAEGISDTNFVDTRAEGGRTYSYRVRGVDSTGICQSPASNCVSATAFGPCNAPPVFAGLTSVSTPMHSTCTLNLSWSAASSLCSGTISYEVFRSTTPGFAPSAANRIAANLAATSFSDTTALFSGTPYYYVVRAVDSANGLDDGNLVERSGTPAGPRANQQLYGQSFDSLSAGDLAGWGRGFIVGDANDWRGTVACNARSAPNSFRYGGSSADCTTGYGVSKWALAWPGGSTGLSIPAGSINARLSFWHRWDFELSGQRAYDGAMLMVSLDGSSVTQVPASAIVGGTSYNRSVYNGGSCTPSGAAGRPIWGGSQTSYVNTLVDLDVVCNLITGTTEGCGGRNVRIGFAVVADCSTGAAGWFIDDVVVTADVPQGCTSAADDVSFFTATTGSPGSGRVLLEWKNPTLGGAYLHTRVQRKVGSAPTGPTDGTTVCTDAGAYSGQHRTCIDTAATDNTTYHYAAYVANTSGLYSSGKVVVARPFTPGDVKWAYSTAASAMTNPGILPGLATTGGVFSVSNDRNLHGMTSSEAGGAWPANWTPLAMNAPAQGRPPIIPISLGGASKVAMLGSQDGHLYAVNADTGAVIWMSSISSGPGAEMFQAAPSVLISDPPYNATGFDYILAGTRNTSSDNAFYAFHKTSGVQAFAPFTNGGGASGFGIVSGAATIDLATKYIYFTSRAKAGGSQDTLWCLRIDPGPPASLVKVWSRALGDIDGGAVLANGRLYVGTNQGRVFAIDPATGANLWTSLPGGYFDCGLAGGPVKGFVFPAFGQSRLYLSTTNTVWALDDGGSTASASWTVSTIPSPSTPLFSGGSYIWVGSSDGRLYQIPVTGAAPTSRVLGDGSGAVGAPAYEYRNGMIHVGTDAGVVYGVKVPF
ncbi:MAG TPA: S8 family serine peptidase [Thermoanaerobaculaceae bacterium]|nr:S8 family serine peptidase [Thermoanaerobaculaceae bacterium]HRS16120.1 S8 family serine peptidase [Thermoanaerobaculaceae bacterium]